MVSPAEVLISVVVPTYREVDNLPRLVPRITAALKSWPHEIIIVDDNSKDGTEQAVGTLRREGHAVRLVLRTDQRGLSSAVVRGNGGTRLSAWMPTLAIRLRFCLHRDGHVLELRPQSAGVLFGQRVGRSSNNIFYGWHPAV